MYTCTDIQNYLSSSITPFHSTQNSINTQPNSSISQPLHPGACDRLFNFSLIASAMNNYMTTRYLWIDAELIRTHSCFSFDTFQLMASLICGIKGFIHGLDAKSLGVWLSWTRVSLLSNCCAIKLDWKPWSSRPMSFNFMTRIRDVRRCYINAILLGIRTRI